MSVFVDRYHRLSPLGTSLQRYVSRYKHRDALVGMCLNARSNGAACVIHQLPRTDVMTSKRIMLKIKQADNMGTLFALHENFSEHFDAIHLASFWTSLGRFGSSRPDALPHGPFWNLLFQSECMIENDELQSRELANVAHAIARLPVTAIKQASPLLDALAKASIKQIHKFNDRDVSNTAWAFAKTGHQSPQLFDAISAARIKLIASFSPQALANTAWSFARAGHSAPALFDEIAVAALANADKLKPQEISNTAWAFASAGHPAPALFDALAISAISMISSSSSTSANVRGDAFRPEEIAGMAWAYGKAGRAAPALFDALAPVMQRYAARGLIRPRELAATAWAYATAGHPAPDLLDALAATALSPACPMNTFKPQELANTVWAYATAQHASQPALFTAAAAVVHAQIGRFKPQEVTSTAWAFATIRQPADDLFRDIAAYAVAHASEYSPSELSQTAWAFATANQATPQLFDALATASVCCLDEFEPYELSVLAWSFAVADVFPPKRLSAGFVNALGARTWATENHLGQLHQFHLWTTEYTPDESVVHELPDELITKCRDTFARRLVIQSAMHAQVAAAIVELGSWAGTHLGTSPSDVVTHQGISPEAPGVLLDTQGTFSETLETPMGASDILTHTSSTPPGALAAQPGVPGTSRVRSEVLLERTGYKIDLVVEWRGVTIGVEVDGPFHYIDRAPDGSTNLKRRQVRALDGLRLCSVPYWEWNQVVRCPKARAAYLTQLLDREASAAPSG